MKNLISVIALFLGTTVAFAGPTAYHEYNNVVGPDSSHTYYVDVVGNDWATAIYLYGACETPQHDIDLWVYEGNRLVGKETGNGCDHEMFIDTRPGAFSTLKVIVENEQKPYNTGYTLIVE